MVYPALGESPTKIKAKGAAAGDVMDAQTEEMLWPQVVNEALARGIVEMVQQLHRASHLWAAGHPELAATLPTVSTARGKHVYFVGTVRRIIVRAKDGRELLNFSLTVGVIGLIWAPLLLAIGGIVGLAKEFTIVIERKED